MTPQEQLDAADALLAGRTGSLWRCWQRACAALIRTALEQVLDRYWQRRAPSVVHATTRTQLLVLPVLAGAETAELARSAWNGLCRAVHHHTYELPPTAAELRGWHRNVTTVWHVLDAADGSGAGSSVRVGCGGCGTAEA